MKKKVGISAANWLAGIALVLGAPFAMAHDQPRVNWSISVGTPFPAPVYSPPPVVYVQPAPVYMEPQPVYVERSPVVQYRSYYPGPYYREEMRHRDHRRWNHHYRGD